MFVAAVHLSYMYEVELTSTLPIPEGQLVCPGDVVTFTCIIRGSPTLINLVLVWISTNYIGENAHLQFTTDDNMVGDIDSSMINGDVVATVTSNTFINEVPILE